MLQKLSINNYALISKKIIDFNKEFTVITGETGSGKSIIFGAIELLIGTRSSNKVLKNPKSKCVVEGVFSMNEKVEKELVKMDLDIEDDLIIRREIKQNGNSRSFINDSPVKLEQLKFISQFILEINGQHLVSKMGSLNFKYGFIDSFINDKNIFLEYRDAHLNYIKSVENQERIIKKVKNLNEKKDFLQFQVDELSNYNIDQWDEESIQNEHQIAANQEEINTLLDKIKNIYNTNGGFSDLFSDLDSYSSNLDAILKDFTPVSKRLKSVKIELEDIFQEISYKFPSVNPDKNKLNDLDQLLKQINFLLKKFNVADLKSLILKKHAVSKELSELSEMDSELLDINKKVELYKTKCLKLGNDIYQLRLKEIPTIESKVNNVLNSLSMDHADFKIELFEDNSINDNGTDQINLLISVNNSLKYFPLHKFSSGGELSRIALAMKYVSTSFNSISTIIFDEIDSGISGKVASEVGSLLKEISSSSQVINITHLPQVAAIAKHHIYVNKSEVAGVMETSINYLSREDRVQVLAKMLGGDKTGKAALNNAIELLN